MINFTINGKKLSADENLTILEAAKIMGLISPIYATWRVSMNSDPAEFA